VLREARVLGMQKVRRLGDGQRLDWVYSHPKRVRNSI
jgi:hypothetical protein